MASSSPPEPRDVLTETRLDTLAALADAIDSLIDLAQDRLQVFDRDLSDSAWNGAKRARQLAAFFRRSRNAHLALIVHAPRYLESSCPRILDLLKVHGHVMQVWRTGPEARNASDALVIADGRHCLRRYHADQARATLVTDAPAIVKPLVARFDEIWATGEPALGGSVLGL